MVEPLSIAFYKEEGSGNEPVREWLLSLNKEARKEIGHDLCTVQLGWPLGMPLVRSLGNGLWEVRSRISNGITRVIFKMSQGEMILLHGFIKKSQKMPKEDLELAKIRSKKYG